MRKFQVVLAVFLLCGTWQCFAENEIQPVDKDDLDRFGRQINEYMKLPPKTVLNAAQTLAYHRFREFAEPKLIDILKRLNGKSPAERKQGREDLKIAKDQIRDDLNLIVFGIQVHPAPAAVPAPAPAAPSSSENSDSSKDHKDDDTDKTDVEKKQLQDLMNQDRQLEYTDQELGAEQNYFKNQLERIKKAEESGAGDVKKLRRQEESLARILDVYQASRDYVKEDRKHIRKDELGLFDDLDLPLPPWAKWPSVGIEQKPTPMPVIMSGPGRPNSNGPKGAVVKGGSTIGSHQEPINPSVAANGDKGRSVGKNGNAWSSFGVENSHPVNYIPIRGPGHSIAERGPRETGPRNSETRVGSDDVGLRRNSFQTDNRMSVREFNTIDRVRPMETGRDRISTRDTSNERENNRVERTSSRDDRRDTRDDRRDSKDDKDDKDDKKGKHGR